ncbi:MAG: UbiA family prenyltransferase [Candidatus Thermoplasmatota archaeon]|nr:UbiA family prenyltransferase [Candidatus Thermoplasmatota archaeon]
MQKIKAIWELMRLEHGIMLALGIFIGSIISLQTTSGLTLSDFPVDKFILTFFVALFLEASTFALNDYFDLPIDKENKRKDRPLAREDIDPKAAVIIFFVFFPLGIIFSYFVNSTCFIIALITALFAIFYDVFLKKIKLLSNFYIAYVMAIPFVFGAAAVQSSETGLQTLDPAVIIIALIAFLAGSGREIMKDVMDFAGDTKQGVKSFPKYIGITWSKRIASLFYLTAVGLSILPFIQPVYTIYYYNYVYLAIVLLTDILLVFTSGQLLLNHTIDMAKYRKITLLAIFLGLLSFFLGAFIG